MVESFLLQAYSLAFYFKGTFFSVSYFFRYFIRYCFLSNFGDCISTSLNTVFSR